LNEVKAFFSEELEKILLPCQKSLEINNDNKLRVIIFNGVNGAGKTTTIGKVAFNLKNQGKKVTIAACDTFRAAASQQLEVWAKRADTEIISALKDGEDPAAVAYRAFEFAKENGSDFLSNKSVLDPPIILFFLLPPAIVERLSVYNGTKLDIVFSFFAKSSLIAISDLLIFLKL